MNLKQQIKNRVVPKEEGPETIWGGLLAGRRLHLSSTSYLQRKLGLSERELHPWFRKLVRNVHTAIDIGAAEGEYTLFFLSKPTIRKVLAFEPQDYCLPKLQRNLELNGLGNDPRFELQQKFLGSSLNQCPDTLDAYLPQIKTPCLIKMDVERNEYAILKGCPKLLALNDVRWIIEIHTPELAIQCRTLLEDNGYQVRLIGAAWWRRILPEHRGPYIEWMIATKKPV